MLLNNMSEQFDKVLELAQKLNGPMVVYDKQGGKHLVILGIDEFAQYFDANKNKPVELKAEVNTETTQASEPKVEVGESKPVEEALKVSEESRTQVMPEEFAPVESVVEVPKAPKMMTPPTSAGSQQWHRLGDVIRRVRPEIASEDVQKTVPYQTHDESVVETDELNFLEEPNS
jgi:hypothetical protein